MCTYKYARYMSIHSFILYTYLCHRVENRTCRRAHCNSFDHVAFFNDVHMSFFAGRGWVRGGLGGWGGGVCNNVLTRALLTTLLVWYVANNLAVTCNTLLVWYVANVLAVTCNTLLV